MSVLSFVIRFEHLRQDIKSKATSEVQRKGAKNGKEEKGRGKASKAIFLKTSLFAIFLPCVPPKAF